MVALWRQLRCSIATHGSVESEGSQQAEPRRVREGRRMWPTPSEAARQFYDSNLKSAVGLLASIEADRRSRGSGRPPGQPQAEWRAVLVLALAALEAGLVDAALAAHHHRIVNRSPVGSASADLNRARGRLLDSLPHSSPNAQKIENFVLAHFGVLPSNIVVPSIARFTTRVKSRARGGAGQGIEVAFTGDWRELAARLDAIQHFRNAIVHADARKKGTIPPAASSLPDNVTGSLWALQEDGSWSLQMPHAVTAVRTTVAVFNTVASVLDSASGLSGATTAALRCPDDVVPFR